MGKRIRNISLVVLAFSILFFVITKTITYYDNHEKICKVMEGVIISKEIKEVIILGGI